MPFAVYLSIKAARSMPYKKLIIWGLAIVAVIWQLCGFAALSKVSEESAQLTRSVLANSKKVVASDIFFLPEQTPELFFERDFCEVTNLRQLDALLAELSRRGENEFVFITSPKWSRLDQETRKKLSQVIARFGNTFKFESSASGFMDLVILQIHLKTPPYPVGKR